MSEWQPIETAPKNATQVLIYSPERCANCTPNSAGMHAAHWEGGHWITGRLVKGGVTLEPNHEPTHWMPLPSPPVTGKE